jgi:hypothetical protein
MYTMSPFQIKRLIQNAEDLAAEFQFELREHGTAYSSGEIYLYATPENEIFAKEMVLERFKSWDIAQAFLAGYAKSELANSVGRKK